MVAFSRKLSVDRSNAPSLVNILGDAWSWQSPDAHCNIVKYPEVNPDWWYPSTGESKEFDAKAKERCEGCPIRDACLRNGWDEYGTWGGMTWEERHGHPEPTTSACGSEEGWNKHQWNKIEVCEPCARAHSEYQKGVKARYHARKKADES